MNAAENIIRLMREQGQREGKGLQLAEMKDGKKCRVGDLLLDSEDYLKASHLNLQAGDMVVVYRLNEQTYIILEKVV